MMRFSILAVMLLCLLGCGGSGPSGPVQIELTSAGLNPASIRAPSAGQVHFVNHDAADHQIASTACPELASPKLAHNGEFTATLGVGPKPCSFSDSLNPSATAFQGTVTVGAPGGTSGSGY